MKCQENKTKVYQRQNWRMPTLIPCELDDNRDLVTQHIKAQACDAGAKDSSKLICADHLESLQLQFAAEIHMVQTTFFFFHQLSHI